MAVTSVVIALACQKRGPQITAKKPKMSAQLSRGLFLGEGATCGMEKSCESCESQEKVVHVCTGVFFFLPSRVLVHCHAALE